MRPIDHLFHAATTRPDAIAIAGPGAPIPYGELAASVVALAAALQSLDPAEGSRVGICAWNTVEHLLAVLATYAAGKVWVPLNPRNVRADLDRMIAATRPTLIVADQSCLGRFTPGDARVVVARATDGTTTLPNVRALIARWKGQRPTVGPPADDDPQIIKFSGGSTGSPKPVVQSVRCLNAQIAGITACFEPAASEVNVIAAPLTHGASCFVLPVLAAGGAHVLVDNPKPGTVLDAIERYGATMMYAPPTLIHALVADPGVRTRSLGSLRHLIYSAAPMRPDQIRAAQAVFGPVVETAYGQVEAPQIITALRGTALLDAELMTSVGRPSPVAEVAIMAPNGTFVPDGDPGEIVVRGPLVMSGYLDRPDLTAETIVDGWLHTGDIGVLDARGYLHIRGRLRELVNTGGFKVSPAEVEAALTEHPAVAECSVFGAPDDRWGEAVHVAVRLADGASASGDELRAFVKERLGSVKAPKVVHFVSELPRNPAGKISRADVRRMLLLG